MSGAGAAGDLEATTRTVLASAHRPVQHLAMAVMSVLAVVMLLGIAASVTWSGTSYRTWQPVGPDALPVHGAAGDGARVARPSVVASRYARGVAVALVAGFWSGVLVTGPAVRLIMRLLAVTAGEDAQGRVTEADQVVGEISVEGTLGLIVFAGIFSGILSAAIYVLIRGWLPAGWSGGVAFGLLHLVVAATVVDPLRPDNRDFDIVGPGWLAVALFGATCVLHGIAVRAFAHRYSRVFPPSSTGRSAVARSLAPLVPACIVLAFPPVLVVVMVGLLLALLGSRSSAIVRVVRSRGTLIAARVAFAAVALALLPNTLVDLHDIVVDSAG